MRLGIVVELARIRLDRVPELASEVASAGLEILLLRGEPGRPHDAVAAAASCASVAPALHIGSQVPVGTGHPLYLAEERNVVDQLLGGRFVLALDGGDDPGELGEWAELLLRSGGTVPFAHDGPGFRIPARLPENDINPEEKVRVTPEPFGLDPQVWVSGNGGAEVAATYGLSLLADEARHGVSAAAAWEAIDARLGRAALRLRRPAVRAWGPVAEGGGDLARRLAAERAGWGLDTALLEPAPLPGTDAWRDALTLLARTVRPRVQLHRLPAGLEDFWDLHDDENREATT